MKSNDETRTKVHERNRTIKHRVNGCSLTMFHQICFVFVFFHLGLIGLTRSLCNDGSNPCQLDPFDSKQSYFLPINGYHCLDSSFNDQDVYCTCPDRTVEKNRPCRKRKFQRSIDNRCLFFHCSRDLSSERRSVRQQFHKTIVHRYKSIVRLFVFG